MLLPKLSEQDLTEVCTGLSLVIKDGKKEKKQAMRNAIRRYMCSEEMEELADEGLSIFQKLKDNIEDMLQDQMEVEAKSKLEDLKQAIDNTLSSGSKGG